MPSNFSTVKIFSKTKDKSPFSSPKTLKPWTGGKNDEELLQQLIDIQLCTPFPLVGNVVLQEGDTYCQQVYIIPKDCTFVAFNPITLSFQEINTMSTKIGLNTTAFGYETRDFTCEIPAPVGSGPVIVTNASLIASLAGGTFDPSGLPTDDAATVYLHSMEGVLANLNDEAAGGFVSTTCQAVGTDVETGKAKDIEPGGNYEFSTNPGSDVPDFSIEIAEGSNMVFCGEVSIKLDKSNVVVPK